MTTELQTYLSKIKVHTGGNRVSIKLPVTTHLDAADMKPYVTTEQRSGYGHTIGFSWALMGANEDSQDELLFNIKVWSALKDAADLRLGALMRQLGEIAEAEETARDD